jgi:CRP/FNR family cyclic AMP-dependent transcriptional regulator
MGLALSRKRGRAIRLTWPGGTSLPGMVPRSRLPEGGARLDDDVRAAIEVSHLRSLSSQAIAGLTSDAWRLRVPAGSTIHREGDTSAHLEVVVSGLIRVYVTAPDGRTMTVRYCRPGALIGVVSLFASSFSLPATIQAVTEAELLAFRPSVVRRAAERDARVARVLVDELSERVLSFIAEIPGSAFATVRQRVARHLLDLASESQSGSELVAAIGQQDLAEAVGTVREVVVRALRELRQAGLVETRREGIVLLDPERLLTEAYAGEAGTKVPVRWNQGR